MSKLPVKPPKPVKEIPDYKKDDDKSFDEIMRAYGKIK